MECFLRMSVQRLVHLSFPYKCMMNIILALLIIIFIPVIFIQFTLCTLCHFRLVVSLYLYSVIHLVNFCYFMILLYLSVCFSLTHTLSFSPCSPISHHVCIIFSSTIIKGFLLDLESSCKFGIQLDRKGYNNNYF